MVTSVSELVSKHLWIVNCLRATFRQSQNCLLDYEQAAPENWLRPLRHFIPELFNVTPPWLTRATDSNGRSEDVIIEVEKCA